MYFTDAFLTPIAVRISAFLSAEVMYFTNPPSRLISNGGSVQISHFFVRRIYVFYRFGGAVFF
jgi:hypothetical protein